MTPSDAPETPRRGPALSPIGDDRAGGAPVAVVDAPGAGESAASAESGAGSSALRGAAPRHPGGERPRALAWLHEDAVTGAAAPTTTYPLQPVPLIDGLPRRSVRPAVLLAPLALLVLLGVIYAAAMLLWPLHAVTPQVETRAVQTTAAAPAELTWPAEGSAAVGAAKLGPPAASGSEAVPMASIAKVVTALVVLDAMPLALGEQGPSYAFTSADRAAYRSYLAAGESALSVPVGGTLSQYQLLEGMLVGSAGNYADYLTELLYPSDAVYARAANAWLGQHGLPGITVVDPSGIDPRNVATPAALVALAQRALAHPVIAEIVAKTSVDLPGAGVVENTNVLLKEPGVVGVKTGFLGRDYNMLTARDIVIGGTTVRVFASVLGQPTGAERFDEARRLLSALDAQLQPTLTVPAGTVVGTVSPLWADAVDVVTESDASVILWNGGAASASPRLALGEKRGEGADAGSLAVVGPVDSVDVRAVLSAELEDPSPWWRLTHPLELLGLAEVP